MKRKFYLAYGANTNFNSMKNRCPRSTFIEVQTLENMRLIFRGVADVVDAPGDSLQVALWSITKECEDALDVFEGFPRLYVKRYVTIHVLGVRQRAMLYVMRSQHHQALPSHYYEQCLREGYRDCRMNPKQIDRAIERVKQRAMRVQAGHLPAHKIQPQGTKVVTYRQGDLPLSAPAEKPKKKKAEEREVIITTPRYLQKRPTPTILKAVKESSMFRSFKKAMLLED